MSSYPPRREIFSHRRTSSQSGDSTDSVAGGGIYTRRNSDLSGTDTDIMNNNDGNGSVSSAGTDRASNHNNNRTANIQQQQQQQQMVLPPQPPLYSSNPSTLPVPTTVMAAMDSPNNNERSALVTEQPVKLTAEALAKQNQALLHRKSSTASSISWGADNNGSGSGAATPAHFQPFGEDVSSLGSLAEVIEESDKVGIVSHDPLADNVASAAIIAGCDTVVGDDAVGEVQEIPIQDAAVTDFLSPSGNRLTDRVLSDMALSVHATLSVETPPKDNLSTSSKQVTINSLPFLETPPVGTTTPSYNEMQIPIELARLQPTPHTPPSRSTPTNQSHVVNRLLPMGGGSAPPVRHVCVDSTIASIRPPSAQPSFPKSHNSNTMSPYPASPKPPSAIRVSNTICYSPNLGIHRPNNNKKSTFIENRATLTRTSSNASSGTNATNNSSLNNRTERIRLGVCAMDKKARSKPIGLAHYLLQ